MPIAIQIPLLTLGTSDHHGENAGGFFLILLPLPGLAGPELGIDDQVSQRCVVENARRGVANVEKYLVQRPVRNIPVNQFAQLLGIAEWSQRAVNESDDFAEMNLGRLTAQL